jgi:septal ring factor EnvC (AmiA/AmiB activator)
MAYQYRGAQTIQAEQERHEQLKAELAEERSRLKEAMRIRRENERLEQQILRTQQRAQELSKPAPTMPAPIHGGRAGLRAAAEEAAAHERRKRHELAA